MGRNLVRGLAAVMLIGGLVHASGNGADLAFAEAAPQPENTNQELPDGVTADMVETGEAVYSGDGLCMTCHGAEGAGTPVGPALADGDWIHIDGSYEEIVSIVEDGVMEPEEFPGAMLPRGGSDISDDEVRAVAAYVWTLAQGE